MRAFIAVVIVAVASTLVRADVDISGSWKVHQGVCFGGPCTGGPVLLEQCDWTVAQAGTALTVSIDCQGFDPIVGVPGTIDTVTGAFSLASGPAPPFCTNVVTVGHA